MRILSLLILCLFITACTDHGKVMREYKNGNKNADDLLLHGLQMKNSEYISSELIDQALRGDEKAKEIIYAQIDTLRGYQESSHHTAVVIPYRSGGK